VPREKDPMRVVHKERPELGVGEVNDILTGKPPVVQVFWPEAKKYGYYLASDVARVSGRGPSPDPE
jgi:hypothetical protein